MFLSNSKCWYSNIVYIFKVHCSIALIPGTTKLKIMTFSIMTFSIMTFSIMTFSIMTVSITILSKTTLKLGLSVIMTTRAAFTTL
jgi:hypothetical protein